MFNIDYNFYQTSLSVLITCLLDNIYEYYMEKLHVNHFLEKRGLKVKQPTWQVLYIFMNYFYRSLTFLILCVFIYLFNYLVRKLVRCIFKP